MTTGETAYTGVCFFYCREEIGGSGNDAKNDCECLLFDGCHFEYCWCDDIDEGRGRID